MALDQDSDRFDMPKSALNGALVSHREAQARGITRLGMYIPTRLEVRTMPIPQLELVLDFWFGEGPVELIPSDQQIQEVIHELQKRPDCDELSVKGLIDLCHAYLSK